MANRIGRVHKTSLQKSQQPGVTNYYSNSTEPTSHSHDKQNENIYAARKESLSADIYSIPNTDFYDSVDDIIQTKSVYRPQNTNMLDKNFNVDYYSHYFETARKTITVEL